MIRHIDVWSRFWKSLTCVSPVRLGDRPAAGLASFILCGAELELNPPRTWPPDYTTTMIVDIDEAKLRGVIAGENTQVRYSSPWHIYSEEDFTLEDFYPGDLPTLVIDISEQPLEKVSINRSYSLTLNESNSEKTENKPFDFSGLIDDSEVTIDRAEWFVNYEWPETSVIAYFDDRTGRNGSIVRSGRIQLSANSPEDNPLVIIPKPDPNYDRVNNTGGLFNVSGSIQFFDLQVESGTNKTFTLFSDEARLKMIDRNSRSIPRYFEPFEINISVTQDYQSIGYQRSQPARIVSHGPFQLRANVSITIYYRKNP